jgi:hypothetical protein
MILLFEIVVSRILILILILIRGLIKYDPIILDFLLFQSLDYHIINIQSFSGLNNRYDEVLCKLVFVGNSK